MEETKQKDENLTSETEEAAVETAETEEVTEEAVQDAETEETVDEENKTSFGDKFFKKKDNKKDEQIAELNDKLMRKMAERSCGKITQEELAEMCKEDIWLEPEEAFDMGFIDEIIKER